VADVFSEQHWTIVRNIAGCGGGGQFVVCFAEDETWGRFRRYALDPEPVCPVRPFHLVACHFDRRDLDYRDEDHLARQRSHALVHHDADADGSSSHEACGNGRLQQCR